MAGLVRRAQLPADYLGLTPEGARSLPDTHHVSPAHGAALSWAPVRGGEFSKHLRSSFFFKGRAIIQGVRSPNSSGDD